MKLRARRSVLILLALLAGILCGLPALGQQPEPRLPPLPLDGDAEEPVAEPVPEVTSQPVPEATSQPVPEATSQPAPEDLGPRLPVPPPPARDFGCRPLLPADAPPALVKKIDQTLKNKDLVGAHVGILAVAYPEGRLLYARNPHDPVNPASVTKLLTAAGTLAVLGPDKRFVTRVFQETGECPPIVIKGGGDPGLQEEDVEALAKGVKEKGVTCAEQVQYDVSLFDDQILPPHYEEKTSDAHWRPKIGALGMADGSITVKIHPGDYEGAAPTVRVTPDCSCVMVDSRAVTVEAVEEGKHLAVSVGELNGSTVVRVTGQIPLDRKKGVAVRKAMPHPDLFTACFFRDALRRAGVQVRQKGLQAVTLPEEATQVARRNSNSLKTDLRRMQRWSKNFVAEQFVKLAGEGRCTPLSFACGLQVLRRSLARFHINSDCLRWENGSGLYDANRVSPAQTVRLLVEIANHPEWGTLYREALPLGAKSGTLRERMKHVKRPVRAKTGTLDHISALAGYVERAGGGYIAFAIFFSKAQTTAYRLRRIQDDIVRHLAEWKPDRRK